MAITPIFMPNSLVLNSLRHSGETKASVAGFTLLEVLMVVLIIGILTAVVVLSINLDQGPHQVEKVAEDLSNQFSLVEDEALARREVWGVQVNSQGLSFRRMDTQKQQWVVSKRSMLQPDVLLPDGLNLEIDHPVALSALAGSARNDLSGSGGFQPDAYILPDGMVTPINLRLQTNQGLFARFVLIDTLGRIVVQEHKPDPAEVPEKPINAH